MAIAATSCLASTDEVPARLGDARVALLHVDENTEAFAGGHIPGASGIHWKNDLQDPIRRDFIGPDGFAALMDRLGIDNDAEVILSGRTNNWFGAYAFWYFPFYRPPV